MTVIDGRPSISDRGWIHYLGGCFQRDYWPGGIPDSALFFDLIGIDGRFYLDSTIDQAASIGVEKWRPSHYSGWVYRERETKCFCVDTAWVVSDVGNCYEFSGGSTVRNGSYYLGFQPIKKEDLIAEIDSLIGGV